MNVAVGTYGDVGNVRAILYDAQFKEVWKGAAREDDRPPTGEFGENSTRTTARRASIKLEKPWLWSAEKPYLYKLVLKCGEDIRAKRIGLKEQRIVGEVFYVNGKPIKFKGVRRARALRRLTARWRSRGDRPTGAGSAGGRSVKRELHEMHC